MLDTSVLFTLEDLADVQSKGYAKHYSTVAEYHSAQDAHIDNKASEQNNAGRNPYLISREAVEMGVHPFITIYDVARERQDGLVGIATSRRTYFLEPDTLLAWR